MRQVRARLVLVLAGAGSAVAALLGPVAAAAAAPSVADGWTGVEVWYRAVGAAAAELSGTLGPDPDAWLTEADRTSFVPELIPDTIRRTNRPTYQQVLEFLAP